MSNKEDREGVT